MTDCFAALVDARRNGTNAVEGDGPASLDAAFTWQKRIADALGRRPAGWKVASHPEHGPIAAPMLDGDVHASAARVTYLPGLALEVEIGLTMTRPSRPGAETRTSIVAAIATSGLGLELVRSRLKQGTGAPFPTFLADGLANVGYVTGPFAPGWREVDPATLTCQVTHNGTVIHDGPCAHAAGDPLTWLTDYANAPRDAFGGLKPGEIITTGALCGVIPLPGPGHVTVTLSGFGTAELTLV